MRGLYILLYILLFLAPLSIVAQENSAQKKVRFNYGVKIGTHASTYNSIVFDIPGYEFDDRAIHSGKIGVSVSPFVRISKGALYIQTEADLCLSKIDFDFREKEPVDEITATRAKYELSTYSIQVPLQLGYNFIENDTYAMSVFTGPMAKFTLTAHDKQKFEGFNLDLCEEIRPTTYYWEIGLGVKIHKIFFDFTFDLGLNRHTKGVIDRETGTRYYAKRSDNNLSFSIGLFM